MAKSKMSDGFKTKSSGTKPTTVVSVYPDKVVAEGNGGGIDSKFLAQSKQVPAGYPEVAGGCSPQVDASIKRMAAEKITGNS